MLELTWGELFIVVFVTIAVVSAPWWGRTGAWLGRRLAGQHNKNHLGSQD